MAKFKRVLRFVTLKKYSIKEPFEINDSTHMQAG